MTSTRLIAYAPNGASQGPLPTPDEVSAGYPLNDVGALAFAYQPDAPRVSLLGQPVELAVEVSWDGGLTWQEPASSRFMYLRDGRDPIKTGDAFAVECAAYVIRMQKALVGFTGLNGEGNREFVTQTPGAILATLWDEAVARGALSGMSRSWSPTADSAGTPWPSTIAQIAYEPGKDLLAILQEFAEMGLVDFRTTGRTVDMFVQGNASGMGADRTTGGAPVTLRFGRDLTEAPFRRTWEGLADTAMVRGDNGTFLERTSAAAIKPWGRQETYVTASGVDDEGTLTVVADAALTLSEKERVEHTFGLDFRAATHMPFRDYAPGEWVLAATDGGEPQRMRVRQVTLTRDDDGVAAGNVVLNDRFLEADVLQARRLQKLTQGATQGGTGTETTPGTSGNDILAPAQVTGLNATSAAYVRPDGIIQAQISLDWNDVTTNADGTVASEVDHYEVWGRRVGAGAWALLANADTSAWSNSPYDPAQDWEFQVRAVDTVFNRGQFSAIDAVTTASDTTAPVKPSTPTATTRLGAGRITWDGLSSTGGAMDADFTHVRVHMSQVNGFTPSTGTQVGELGKNGGYVVVGPLDYSSTYYARLVPYDSSGNAGTPSDQVTFTVAALVDVTNFPDDAMTDLYARTGKFLDLSADNFSANLIEGAWVKTGTLETQLLSVSARLPSILPNAAMEKESPLFAGRPDFWDPWYGSGSMGLVQPGISGGQSMRITCAAGQDSAGGNANGGDWYTVVPGEKYALRALVRPNVAYPAGKNISLRIHTSTAATNPNALGDSGATWHTQDLVGPLNAGQVYEVQFAITVPADHVKMGIGYGVPDIGAAQTVDFDMFEVFPAVADGQITTVGAGKIRTGLLQATERIVAGALSGARAELNGVGFQAFDSAGTKTFEVLASDGSVYTAGTFTTKAGAGAGRVEISASQNPYQSGQTWASLNFYSDNSSWDPAVLWAVYGSDAATNWGTLAIRGPKLGTRSPAAIDLRSEEQTNATSIDLRVQTLSTEAQVHLFGDDGAGRVTIRQRYAGGSQGFSFQSPGKKRVNFDFDTAGTSIIQAKDENNAQARLMLDGSTIEFVPQGTGNLIVSPDAAGNPWIGRSNLVSGIRFNNGAETGSRANNNNLVDHKAAAHTTGSDSAWKDDQEPLVDSLDAWGVLDALEAKSWTWVAENAPRIGQRGIGFIAQEVQAVLPEAVTGVAVSEGGEGLAIDIVPLVAVLWSAVRDLQAEVVRLKRDTRRRKP